VADATTAFFQVLLSGKNGEAYNVGNTAGEISIFELASKLVGLFPERGLKVIKSTVLPEGYLSSVVSRISPDLSKIEKLGWVPDTDLDNGFYRTIISYG
jgi:nucleoside-diphosphate-sugar epimerase